MQRQDGQRQAAMAFILITLFIDILGIGIIIPILPELVKQFVGGSTDVASRYVGVIGAAYALMQFVCAPIMGALSDRFGRRPVLLASLFGLGVDFLIQGFAPHRRVVVCRSDLSWNHGRKYYDCERLYRRRFDSRDTRQELRIVGCDVRIGVHFWPSAGRIIGQLQP